MHKRKIMVGDVVYESIAAAARAMSVDPLLFRNWLVSKNPKWAHIQYVAQDKASKITRTKGVQVCFRGKLYDSLQQAARQHEMTAPNVAHYVNSHHHPDSYYLKPDGERVKYPEKCEWRISEQTRQRAAKAKRRRDDLIAAASL